MILRPVGIRRLGSRLKGRRLQRVAPYTIPDIGPGVIFDFGDLRIWNAALEPDRRNLVPVINGRFNFRIDNFLKLPLDIAWALEMIRLNFKDDHDFKTGRAVITVEIGREIRLCYGLPLASIPVPKSRRRRPVTFGINLLAFEKLIGSKTYIGYENPDPEKKDSGCIYLKDEGEHVVKKFKIKKENSYGP